MSLNFASVLTICIFNPSYRCFQGTQCLDRFILAFSLSDVLFLRFHVITNGAHSDMFFQLSALLSDVGLNIREAHVFSTVDGYSLDVFVVDGWDVEVSYA